MRPATTTPEEIRDALLNRALIAGAHLRPQARPSKTPLREAIHHANEILAAAVVDDMAPEDIADPEQMILRFIAAGGNWPSLVAAVNRNALRGATLASRDKHKDTGQ